MRNGFLLTAFTYTALVVILLVQTLIPNSYLSLRASLFREDFLASSNTLAEARLTLNQAAVNRPESQVTTGKFVEGMTPPAWLSGKGSSSYQGAKQVSTCQNCWLYPVDKNNALASNYEPKVVATNLPGGGQVTPEVREQLVKLFTAAQAKGLAPKINSAYRSYQDQINTYNYWVQREVSRGKSRAEAEEEANRFSARPGHSEHQLGTTVDINCLSCTAFDRSNKASWGIWNFLAEQAHTFGFVVSFPEGKESLTGYVYEPWHVRYIGVDRASKLFELGYLKPTNEVYLAKFLSEQGAD